MQTLRIVNRDGIGNNTEIYIVDGDETIRLRCVKSIEFERIDCHNLISAKLEFERVMFDIFTKIKKPELYVLQKIHNQKELARKTRNYPYGLRRIN